MTVTQKELSLARVRSRAQSSSGSNGPESKPQLPKKFLEKIALHFDKVQRAWLLIRKRVPRNEVMSAETFYHLCDKQLRIGLNEQEIKQLTLCLDKDGNGNIDFEEFNAIIGPVLQPKTIDEQQGGHGSAKKREQEARGRMHSFKYDHVVNFNNKFRQTLDESGNPLLKNIFQGMFTSTDKPDCLYDNGKPRSEVVVERPTGKRVSRTAGFEFDHRRNVPMIQSVMEGTWYGDKHSMEGGHHRLRNGRQRTDLLQRNRRVINDYSKVVSSIKPLQRKSPFPINSSITPHVVGRPPYIREMDVPRSVGEIGELYGREGGEIDAAESIIAYLEGATADEKSRYMRALRRSTDDMRQPLVYGSRGLRPTLQNLHRSSPLPLRPASSLASSRGPSAHQQALSAATELARSVRPPRRPETAARSASVPLLHAPQPSRPSTAAMSPTHQRAGPARFSEGGGGGAQEQEEDSALGRAEVPMGEGGGRGAWGEGRSSAGSISGMEQRLLPSQRFTGTRGRRTQQYPGGNVMGEKRLGNRMHLDLQRAAFGATFNAQRLSNLKRVLEDNAAFALGSDGL